MGSSLKLPENPYSNTLARISREQWDHWREVYEPVEGKLRLEADNYDRKAQDRLDNVSTYLSQGLSTARGINTRTMDRYRATQPSGTATVNNRLDKLAFAAGSADGRNRSKLDALDGKMQLMSGLNSIGNQVAGQAISTYGDVAGMAQSRINASQIVNPGGGLLAGGLSGALSGYAMGGGWGALAGGLLGAGIGYYANS